MQQPLTCFSPDGSAFEWQPIWVRLPEFLTAYPPKDGWRVELRHGHLLDQSPALLELAKAAIGAGKDLQSIGLNTADLAAYVYEARLVDGADRVVRSASARAVAPSAAVKTWEAGETAALNRLLAMLGFGGHVLGDDEARDRLIQGITVQAPATTTSAGTPPPESGNAKSHTKPPRAVTGKQIEDKGVSKQVQRYILKVVEELAGMGVEVQLPELTSDAQARDYLKELESRREARKLAQQQDETIPG